MNIKRKWMDYRLHFAKKCYEYSVINIIQPQHVKNKLLIIWNRYKIKETGKLT